MCSTQTTVRFTSMMAIFFCCCYITAAQFTAEDESKTDTQSTVENEGIEEKQNEKKDGKNEKELDDRPTFDFSLPGNNKTQNFDLFFEKPFNVQILESKSIESKLSGNYFITFQKEDVSPKGSLWKTLRESFSGWKPLSRSYALRLEGNTPGKFALGGYIEIEGDTSIENDPHLHTSLYGQYKPWNCIEVALGSWIEIQRLWKDERLRSGLRTHCNIELASKWINLSMMVEYLPHWRFKSYRLNTSPEIEFKFSNIKIPLKKDKVSFSLVFHGEIDYYSENEALTIEPLFEANPWEIRWTQLVRHRF